MVKKKEKPPIGSRVMWTYGRKDYAEYGEIGTVTAHTEKGITVEIDDVQPFHRASYGSKSKRDGHKRTQQFESDPVFLLSKVYRENAARLRRVAKEWTDAAVRVENGEQ